MKEYMDGYSFVKEIVEFSRDGAVDILLSKAIDECDWLELKASFYVSEKDEDFANRKLLAKKPDGFDDRQWLNELNKGRIVKTIVAMYNSRGGVIFVGLSPDAGHELVPMAQNDPYGILSSGSKGVNDYLSKIDESLAKGYFWFGTAKHYLSLPVNSLFESTILPYKNGCIIALIVKSSKQPNSCIITCDDEGSERNAKSYLVLRTEKGNNKEETVSGITERKKDELERKRFALLQDENLSRYFKEITGGESAQIASRPASWHEVWRKLWTFSFKGKASRTELWMSYGYYSAFILAAFCLSMIFGSNRIVTIVQFLGFILLAPPFVRRLHDWGLSGWCLLVLIGFGMFDGWFPNLATVNRVVNGFFFLGMLSFGCFPGRRIYGKYKGALFSICFFCALLLVGYLNLGYKAIEEVDDVDEPFTGRVSDLEKEPDPSGSDYIVYGLDAVGNEYVGTFDKVVIPALKSKRTDSKTVFTSTLERFVSDIHRVQYLADHLSDDSKNGSVQCDKKFFNTLRKVVEAFDDLVALARKGDSTMDEIHKSFLLVEVETDRLFRRADVLCAERWRGPFLGLVHRISNALEYYVRNKKINGSNALHENKNNEPSISEIERGCERSFAKQLGASASQVSARATKNGNGRWDVRITAIRHDGERRSLYATAVMDKSGNIHYYTD